MTQYSHLFTVVFEVESSHPTGEDVTEMMLRTALISRMQKLNRSHEWLEAVGFPVDSHKIEKQENPVNFQQTKHLDHDDDYWGAPV